MSVTSPGSRSRLARSRRWNGWTPSWALSLATPPSLKPGPSQRFRGLGKPVEGLPPVSQVPRPWVEAVQLAWAVPQAPEDSRPPPPAGVFLPLSPWDSFPHTEPDLTSTAQWPGDLSSRPPSPGSHQTRPSPALPRKPQPRLKAHSAPGRGRQSSGPDFSLDLGVAARLPGDLHQLLPVPFLCLGPARTMHGRHFSACSGCGSLRPPPAAELEGPAQPLLPLHVQPPPFL